MTKPKYRIDGAWLRRLIEDNNMSMRDFARRVSMDIASVSRTIAGTRKLQVHEARLWARVLRVTPEEIFGRMGVRLGAVGSATSEATVLRAPMPIVPPLAGSVDAISGLVTFKPLAAGDENADIVALAIEGDPFMAGWRVFYSRSSISSSADGVDLAIIKGEGGEVFLRKLRPGFTPGHFDLGPAFGIGDIQRDVKLEGVYPVLGMGGIRVGFQNS